MRLLSTLSLLGSLGVFSLLTLGCDERPSEYPAVRPLFDTQHAPDLQTEASTIALPPSLSGNRFLSGWQAWRDGDRVALAPTSDGGRIEIVRLVAEERRLILDLRDGDLLGGSVRVRAVERDLGTFPWRDPLEIPIPADLPLGRMTIDLIPVPSGPGGSATPAIPNVVNAAVRPIQPSGALTVEGHDLIQAGTSRVETVIRATGETELLGTFVPPEKPRPDQRWQLTLEREDGSNIRRFYWSASFWNRLRGQRGFRLPLRGAKGLVRVRLDAWGDGPPGRWRDLAWAGPPELAPRLPGLPAPPTADLAPGPPARLVVIYVMDALRADQVGAFGGPPGITPTIDRLGREGLVALRQRANSPNTLPSTKTLFTGHAFLSRGGWKLGPEDGPTLAEAFGRAGFHTALFSGNVYVSPAYSTNRGFEHDAPEVLIEGYSATAKPPYNDNAERVQAAALAWLRALPPGSRAFLYLHVIHPHNPYDPPPPFRSRWAPANNRSTLNGSTETLTGIKQGRLDPDDADRARLRGLYQGSVAYADDQLGRFVEALATIVPPSETLLAVTADHGEELFDHGGVLHGYTLHEEMLRIPLALWWPGRVKPLRIEEPTDTRDLHATLVDACSLRGPDGKALPSEGRSLLRRPLPIPEGEPLHFAAASSVKGGIYSAQSRRWKLIWAPRTGLGWGMGEGAGRSRDPEYLFDLAADPGERINLAGRGDIEADWLRGRLLAWIAQAQPETDGGEAPVDRETLDRLRALGYVN
ncbi:MAG TPA: sulfatase [Thermoanaerobaculia bacterium]|jgi:arylsulfatase A-like enzyme|nr:sulfatase [Thermoanaerobaculia bacterium]